MTRKETQGEARLGGVLVRGGKDLERRVCFLGSLALSFPQGRGRSPMTLVVVVGRSGQELG